MVTVPQLPAVALNLATKLTMAESLLYIVDKEAHLVPLNFNYTQRLLFQNWFNRILLVKYRQGGISTAVLGLFFIEAHLIPGLVVAIVSHEEYATKRLLDKIDIFHKYLPPEMKSKMFKDSDSEKVLDNGSTIYIGTAGQRAFGRGDTVHRALVSEEAHYANAKKLLSGLEEAIPMSGYLVRESTPLGDSGHYYTSVQKCIEGKSDYKLLPLFWWYCEDYRIPRDSPLILEQDRGDLVYDKRETELVLTKGLTEDQIRWRRWKMRNMTSEEEGASFPQEYIEDLESCWLGPRDRVFQDVDEQIQLMSLKAREPLRIEGILEIWKEPEPGARYIFWVDPAGGEGATDSDPHDGVILRLHAGGLEQVAAICSKMEQKPFAFKIGEIGMRYNKALLVVERNGVGKGVLNYLVNDVRYTNLYMERKPNGELSDKYGWVTSHPNKAFLASNLLTTIKSESIITYDRKTIRQVRALVYKNGVIEGKGDTHDDRAISLMGAAAIANQSFTSPGTHMEPGSYVTFKK